MVFRAFAGNFSNTNSPTGPVVALPASIQVGDRITVGVMATGGAASHLDGFLLDNGNGGVWTKVIPADPDLVFAVSGSAKIAVYTRIAASGDASSNLAVSSISGSNGRWAVGVRVDHSIENSNPIKVGYNQSGAGSTVIPGEEAVPNVGSNGGSALYWAFGVVDLGTAPVLTANVAGGATLRGQVKGDHVSFASSMVGALDKVYNDDTPIPDITAIADADISFVDRGWATVLYDEVSVVLPIANAGNDVIVATGQPFSLSGSGSGGAGGPYIPTWTQVSGTTTPLTGPDTFTPSGTAPGAPETLVYQLVVEDQAAIQSLPDTVNVNVVAAAQTVEIIDDGTVAGFVPFGGAGEIWPLLGDDLLSTGGQVTNPSTAVYPGKLGPVTPIPSDGQMLVKITHGGTLDALATVDVTIELRVGEGGTLLASAVRSVTESGDQLDTWAIPGSVFSGLTAPDWDNLWLSFAPVVV